MASAAVYGEAVSAFYTGANAQEVETAVTTPLEQAINGVEGMLYMTSSSTNSGISTITGPLVGAVVINETSDVRIDSMPFGGFKKSGVGREGVRYAVHEMTEPKNTIVNLTESGARWQLPAGMPAWTTS